jgi:hypothetical protein
MRSVLDNRYPQTIVVAQIALLAAALGYAFDLLDFLDLEACIGAEVAFDEECDEDSPLRVRVDAAAGAALECSHEEGRTGGGLEDLVSYEHVEYIRKYSSYLRLSKVFLAVEVHYEHISRLHEFLLYAAGRNVDFIFMANTGSSACTCYLANRAC